MLSLYSICRGETKMWQRERPLTRAPAMQKQTIQHWRKVTQYFYKGRNDDWRDPSDNCWRHLLLVTHNNPVNKHPGKTNQPSLLRNHSSNPVSPHQWGPSTCHRLSSQFPIVSDRDWRLLLDPKPGDENQTGDHYLHKPMEAVFKLHLQGDIP